MKPLFLPVAAALLLAAAPSRTALDDPTIVAIFDAANTYDIEAGQLALQKSHTAAVQQLARQFMHDHAAVRQQGRDLASRLGVEPTPPKQNPLAPAHEQAMQALGRATGTAFDQAYAAEEVRFHQQVIDAVTTTLLPAVGNEELRAFVQQVAPAFQGHLEAAKHLQKELNAAGSGT